jgi:2-dehydro-3-deoxyphosphogluconate aldolase/(4S)-4-hydroxy-2-oxoglutarate aldolase
MTKEEVLGQVEKTKIVPVVKLDRPEDAKPLCKALCAGGLPAAEITFRTAAAEEAIRIASEAFPEMLIGAGTVTNTDQAERALNAGAKFLVSPGFFCGSYEILLLSMKL